MMAAGGADATARLPTEEGKGSTIHRTPSIPFAEKYFFVRALGSGLEGNCDRYDLVQSQQTNAVETDAIKTDTVKAVAVKSIVRRSPHTNHLHEANILATLPKHPRINEVLEVFQDDHIRIVMPLYCGGDLNTTVRKFTVLNCKMPEAFVWHAFVQIVDGLHHLHTNHVLPILHRDIKPGNLLLDQTPRGTLFDNIKIVDFGLATTVMEPHEYHGGTAKYQPPECPLASAAADVYAVGASIHHLLTGKAPKGDCPADLRDRECHKWYAQAQPLIRRIVHRDHTDFTADKPLPYAEARSATFEHCTPLPSKGYSPLLEYWMLRTLDSNPATRATTSELVTEMAADARRQIDLYEKWAPVSGKRPMCGIFFGEPPACWKPA